MINRERPAGTVLLDVHDVGDAAALPRLDLEDVRVGARLISSAGWNRDDIKLPGGSFKNDLVPITIGYSFTSLASLQGLMQYNRQTSTISSNIRLALLNRSGTGLFVVYNDRRDTSDFTDAQLLGRSFIIKYTRLVDF